MNVGLVHRRMAGNRCGPQYTVGFVNKYKTGITKKITKYTYKTGIATKYKYKTTLLTELEFEPK
jgi:hypothetical protein